MRKTIMILCIVILVFVPTIAFSNEGTSKGNVNGRVLVEDDADLLTPEEKEKITDEMKKLSEYGNVVFKSTNQSTSSDSLSYIKNYYYSKFQNDNGIAFYIDMKNRQICMCATGGLDEKITSSKCNIITDNVYMYATVGKYYLCVSNAFSQACDLLEGRKIAESMKYYSNSFLAMMLSLLISYGLFHFLSNNGKTTKSEIIEECIIKLDNRLIGVNKTGTHTVYVGDSDSSSGGSSGGGSSSSSSGGGFSGSGGSHSF